MKTAKTVALISAICALGLLSGCGSQAKKDATATSKSAAGEQDALKSQFDTGSSEKAADATKDGASADSGKSADANAAKGDDALAPGGLPKGELNIDLASLPGDIVICTVGGEPVKVSDYRNMLKLSQMQFQTNVANDPAIREGVLQQAKEGHVELTSDEKSKLLDAARKEHADMPAFLKQHSISEADFDKQVLEAGLVFKTANNVISQNLMKQLLQRTLLSKAARTDHLEKKAVDKYLLVKNSKDYKELKERSGLTSDELKGEFVNGELATLEIEKIGQSIHVSDAEIRDFYNSHKNQLRHDERVRLSTILVLAPEQDLPGMKSVANQVKQANPNLSDKDAAASVAQILQDRQNKALILLGEAKGKVDFAKLANQNTEDGNSLVKQNGGDMGWQSKSQLVPEFVDAVWNLKPGTVLPKLVKTGEGFRVIKVTGHEKAGIMDISEVRPLIEAKLKQDRLQLAVNNWLNAAQQRADYKISFSKRFVAQAEAKSAH